LATSVCDRKGELRELLRHALDGKAAEFRVLVANLPGIRECRRLAIRIQLFNALPFNNGNTRFRQCAFGAAAEGATIHVAIDSVGGRLLGNPAADLVGEGASVREMFSYIESNGRRVSVCIGLRASCRVCARPAKCRT
jgi:hypothetical protein